MNTLDYLARLRAKYDVSSDYAIAKLLGISKQAVGRYSKGDGGFDDEVARRVANLLEIHPGIVVLDMHRERAARADNDEVRRLWEEIQEGFRVPLLRANRVRGHALTR